MEMSQCMCPCLSTGEALFAAPNDFDGPGPFIYDYDDHEGKRVVMVLAIHV